MLEDGERSKERLKSEPRSSISGNQIFRLKKFDNDELSETKFKTNHASTVKRTGRSSNSRLSLAGRSDLTDETVEPLIEDILPSMEAEFNRFAHSNNQRMLSEKKS